MEHPHHVPREEGVVPDPHPHGLGLTGRIAAGFINSKLTPLLILVSLMLGIGATLILPREEEPQIIVPMADVMVAMPGASAPEIEQQVTVPMEKLIREIEGVEYVYSISRPGTAFIIVRFYVGQNPEAALVRLYNKLYSNQDRMPPGVQWPPLVKPRSIDNVPILAITLHGGGQDGFQLRQIASQLDEQIKQVDDGSETTLIGGRRRQVRIELQPARLAAFGLSPNHIVGALGAANRASASGRFDAGDRSIVVRSGSLLSNVEEVGALVVAANGQRPVYLRDVATISDGAEEPVEYVTYTAGPAVQRAPAIGAHEHAPGTASSPRPGQLADSSANPQEAVTISVAKRRGSNAIVVAERVIEKLATIRSQYVPGDVEMSITRNYGETAAERSNELLEHMGIAVISVVALMWLALGRRESLVVAIAIPVTLALTVCTFLLYNFTLNRVTFFALIFSIGILVDDAIVVVENVVRHLRLPENHGRKVTTVVLEAVDEVGNPTILATLTVMAAILPMAFVRGLMGPYMLPIPLGASAAMAFSLLVAFTIIPWASLRILRDGGSHHGEEEEDALTRLYRRLMRPLIHDGFWRTFFLVGTIGLLAASLSLVAFRVVLFKMLPFDNKSEFQVLVNMPEGSTLERTSALTREIAAYLRTVPEVTDAESYVGTSSPYNFNGLVRHYFTRSGPSQADLQVNLLDKKARSRSSHEIAREVRPHVREIAKRYDAVVQVAEIPPGPPVLQTLVTEVYGPHRDGQVALARDIRSLYEKAPNVVDVDWYLERPQPQVRLVVDRDKAALDGVTVDDVTSALDTALGGSVAGLLHDPTAREPVPLYVRFALPSRTLDGLASLRLPAGRDGKTVPLDTLLKTVTDTADTSIYHKNMEPVVYVIGDVAGTTDSPLYAILDVQSGINKLKASDGRDVSTWFIQQPFTTDVYSVKWDGEWQVTYEVMRDLGVAFAVVVLLIYALIVGWFQNFLTPLVIVSAIPFSLVGIMPGHWLFGAYFSATSMIGFIAGAGIVVRNSIILVDFIELRLAQGMPLEDAVVDAGAVRFRPMMLTAAAVVAGSVVMLADPIFQGLAISLMAGEVASLLLSRTAVPVLYFLLWRHSHPNSSAPSTSAGASMAGLMVGLLALLALTSPAAASPLGVAPSGTPAPVTAPSGTPAPVASPGGAPAATPVIGAGPSPSATSAAQAAPAPMRLRVEEAVDRALASSPALQASQWQEREAAAHREASKAPGRPQIGLESGYTWLTPTLSFGPYPLQVNSNYNAGLVIRQSLATFGRLHWNTENARLQALAAQSQTTQRRLDVRLDVQQAYAQALLTREALRIAEERLRADEAQVVTARKRYEGGTSPRFDVMTMESALAQSRLRLVSARSEVDTAQARLATLLGLPPSQPLEIVDLDLSPMTLSALPPEVLVARSPRLEVARRALEAGKARVEAARAENRPSLDLQTGYAVRNSTAFQTSDLFNVGVQLRIPLADGGLTRAHVDAALAVVGELESELEGARRALLLDVHEAAQAVEVARARVDAAAVARARADEALRVARVRYAAGLSTPVELLDAQATALQAVLEWASARYGSRLAEWRWLHAVGGEEATPK